MLLLSVLMLKQTKSLNACMRACSFCPLRPSGPGRIISLGDNVFRPRLGTFTNLHIWHGSIFFLRSPLSRPYAAASTRQTVVEALPPTWEGKVLFAEHMAALVSTAVGGVLVPEHSLILTPIHRDERAGDEKIRVFQEVSVAGRRNFFEEGNSDGVSVFR